MPAPRRPLSDIEVALIYRELAGPYSLRNKCLFLGLLNTGWRVSELLSLKVGDVFQANQVLPEVYLAKSNSKGKVAGRVSAVGTDWRASLEAWLKVLGTNNKVQPLFPSRFRNKVLSPNQAWRIVKEASLKCNLVGPIGTHSCRKTFAKFAHESLGRDIFLTARALGHVNVESTVKYLASMDDRIKQVALRKLL